MMKKKNPITRHVNGKLTCDAFPRGRGRYEVVCSLVKLDGTVTVASHGTLPGRAAATERIGEVISAMKKNNPLHVCSYCGAKVSSVGKPRFCPVCKKTWRGTNPLTKKEVEHGLKHVKGLRNRAKEYEEKGGKTSQGIAYIINRRADEYRTALYTFAPKSMLKKIEGANPVHPQATKALKRYKEDLKAGHMGAAEYWRGQAGAYFTANPTKQHRTKVEKVGSGLTGMGLIAFIGFIGFIIWMQTKQE